MTEPRTFPLADVLSVTTPRLLSARKMDGVTDLLDFMTGDTLELWQLLRAADEARPVLIAQHPFLADLQPPAGCDKATLQQWLADVVREHGAELPVAALADWVYQDPGQEFVDRVELARLTPSARPAPKKPDATGLAEQMRAMGEAMKDVGAAFREATGATDHLVMASHPELDTLNHELNNIYGGAFEDDPPTPEES